MYHHGYGYAPYNPYSPAGSPVPTVGHDGQLYGAQHYQYPTPYFQQPTPTSGAYPNQAVPPKGGDISATAGSGQVPLSVDTPTNGNSNGNISSGGTVKGNSNVSAPVRSMYQSSSFNANNGSYGRGGALPAASGYQDPRFNYDGIRSPIPWMDGPLYSDGYPVTSSSITSSISNNGNNSVQTSRNQYLRPHSQLMVCI